MKIFQLILKIPVIGTIAYIVNCYVYQGDENATQSFAPPSLWLKVFLVPLFLASILTSITIFPLLENAIRCGVLSIWTLSEFSSKPGAIIVSIVPNLLGFGIGVYALLFSLGAGFVKNFENKIGEAKSSGKLKHGSSLMLNSDIAFPIIVLVCCISIGVLQQVFSSNVILLIITWMTFWYSIITLVEIVGVLFGLVDNSLIEKGASENES